MTDEFTKKHKDITDLMKSVSELAGGCGERTYGRCTTCPRSFNPTEEFRTLVDAKEYKISGMCQQCQNTVFGGDSK